MDSPKPKLDKKSVDVSQNFQNLDYFKKVPKRIDCWLTRDTAEVSSSQVQTARSKAKIKKKILAKNNSSGNLVEKSPEIIYPDNKIKNFGEFSKTVLLGKQKLGDDSLIKTQSINISRDLNNGNKLNESGASYESVKTIGLKRSNFMPTKGASREQSPTEFTSPKQNIADSLFTNENECLDFILRLESKSSNDPIFSQNQRNAIKEDESVYFKLIQSKPLLEILKLMNKAEKVMSDTGNSSIKQSCDFEFERLLLRLKSEFNSLSNNNEKEIMHNIDSKYYTTKKIDVEDEVQLKSPSRYNDNGVSNDSNLGLNISTTSKFS